MPEIEQIITKRIIFSLSFIYGSVFGKRDLLAIFHIMKYDLIAEKLPFQMLQTILKYS